jgi:hypothetical protein
MTCVFFYTPLSTKIMLRVIGKFIKETQFTAQAGISLFLAQFFTK